MRARTALIAVCIALLAAIGYTGSWFYAAAEIRSAVDAWIEARRAEGYAVDHRGLTVDGFPSRITAELAAPAIGRPDDARAWAWQGDRLAAQAWPWAMNRLQVTLPAEQRFAYRRAPGGERIVTATTAQGDVVLEFAGGAVERMTAVVTGLTLTTSEGETRVARIELRGRRADDRLDVSIAIDDVGLPPELDGGLGREIAHVAVDAAITGPLPPALDAEGLAAWSEAGGTVELSGLSLRWGDLVVEGNGTLALDDEMRPLASLVAEITGHAAVLKALADAGTIKPRDAATATTIFNLLAKPGPNGVRVLKVPLSAQNGMLFAGPLSLMKLPPIVPR